VNAAIANFKNKFHSSASGTHKVPREIE